MSGYGGYEYDQANGDAGGGGYADGGGFLSQSANTPTAAEKKVRLFPAPRILPPRRPLTAPSPS